ncbi:MAG TPA: hypothetical protein DC057_02360 [Spirochaetia bacterium]|nr:hypothetical protein [Spirochaetia bacterium]
MNNNLTEIVFILDRSGSMQSLVDDTIGGFNSFVENQKKLPGEAHLTTVLFDEMYEILHNGVNLKSINPLTRTEYYARGMTALLDAIGKTINTVGERLSDMNEKNRPHKVIFVITTDGAENASKEFNQQQIKSMIEHQTNRYNWEFVFLGANMDAVSVGDSYGITRSATYSATSEGTKSVYGVACAFVSNSRRDADADENWAEGLE